MLDFSKLDVFRPSQLTSTTFGFWRETDPWPIYEEPHRELFGLMDAAAPDMTMARASPLASMILAPRFTYKSFGAIKFIARLALRYPNISIGLFRSVREEARKQLRVVKGILERNATVRELYGDVRGEKWDEDEIVLSTRTIERPDPTVFTLGVTGGTSTGNHPDFIFADDLVTEQNCDSVKEQENLWEYLEAFQPLLPKWGGVLVTGTRWSEIDVYGRIQALNDAERRAGVSEDALPWQVYIREAKWQLPDGSWKYYFPQFLDEERLEDMRRKVDTRKYNAWMFNRMVDPSEKPFKERDIHKFCGKYRFDYPYRRSITMDNPEYGGEVIRLYVGLFLDPALTDDKSSSCGYGMTITGFDSKLNWYTLESRERVLLPSRALEVAQEMILTYRPNRIIIESAGGDPELIVALGKFLQREGIDCVIQGFTALIHERKGHRAKHQRIASMERWVSAGRCFFRVADSMAEAVVYGGYCYDLLQQIDKWPSLVLNDAIDSWAMGRYAEPYVPRYDDDFEEAPDFSNPPEWDFTWTDRDGRIHGSSAEMAARIAAGPPPGADPSRWLNALETGVPSGSYRPGQRTAEYLRRRRGR